MSNNNCINITNKWIKNGRKSLIKLYNIGDKYSFRGKKYILDNYHIKYDFNNYEYIFAKWLSKRIQKEVVIIPRISYPLGIKTPDYRIGKTYYDLKTISGNSNQIIYHRIKDCKKQASNFFFDATTSSLTIKQLISQVNAIFKSNNPDRNWVKLIAIKKSNKLIVLKRKR